MSAGLGTWNVRKVSEKCPKSVRKVSEKCPKSGPKSYIFSPNGFRTSHILCVLSVLVQVWDVCGPWNLECPKSVRKVSEKCPKSVRKVTSFRQILDIQPKSNLQPSGLLSADHTHNLAVYSNLAAFGQAESLNRGRVQNVLRPKIGLNRGPKWEK